MNFLQTGRMSLESVALNIITCFSCGVALKISWTSRLMSVESRTKASVNVVSRRESQHTKLFQHLVTFIEDKVLEMFETQFL